MAQEDVRDRAVLRLNGLTRAGITDVYRGGRNTQDWDEVGKQDDPNYEEFDSVPPIHESEGGPEGCKVLLVRTGYQSKRPWTEEGETSRHSRCLELLL